MCLPTFNAGMRDETEPVVIVILDRASSDNSVNFTSTTLSLENVSYSKYIFIKSTDVSFLVAM